MPFDLNNISKIFLPVLREPNSGWKNLKTHSSSSRRRSSDEKLPEKFLGEVERWAGDNKLGNKFDLWSEFPRVWILLLSSLSICPSGETIAKLSYRAEDVFKFHHNREEGRKHRGEYREGPTLSYQPIPLPRLHHPTRSIRNGRSPYERRREGGLIPSVFAAGLLFGHMPPPAPVPR